MQTTLLSFNRFLWAKPGEQTSDRAAVGLSHILIHWQLIHPDNEPLFEGALLMLLLLSPPEKGENPVIAA